MRCNQHISEQRGFCARIYGHEDGHSKYPDKQGVGTQRLLTGLVERERLIQKELDDIKKAIVIRKQSIRVQCMGFSFDGKGCRKFFPAREITYIQTFWYSPPYGCSGGDCWNIGEGQFVCPGCGQLNRLYERPEVEALKPFFNKVVEKYGR